VAPGVCEIVVLVLIHHTLEKLQAGVPSALLAQ
jgi:hypothetical protein